MVEMVARLFQFESLIDANHLSQCSKWRPQRLHRPGKFIGDGDISGTFSKIGCQNRTVNIHISCLKLPLNKTIYA